MAWQSKEKLNGISDTLSIAYQVHHIISQQMHLYGKIQDRFLFSFSPRQMIFARILKKCVDNFCRIGYKW